jgi:electron transfer flavoprotein alpha subunit
VAARVQTGLTADCTRLDIDPKTGLLLQTRPAFGGNLLATIVTEHHRPQMATVRPGVLPEPVRDTSRHGRLLKVEPPPLTNRLTELSRLVLAATGHRRARVIVSAGRGIIPRKNSRWSGCWRICWADRWAFHGRWSTWVGHRSAARSAKPASRSRLIF